MGWRHINMSRTALGLVLLLGQSLSQGQLFECPEPNGFFSDPEQCDKYYECVGEVPEEKFCPDGLLFEASNPNNELCDYPFNVDCGLREYVQEPEPGLDPRCYRANGFFNHEDPDVCNKYYNCVHGYPHLYDCPPPLIFDEAQGTCVREEQASSFARKCERNATKPNIDGFECPEGETIGPNGIPLAHPSFPHPRSWAALTAWCSTTSTTNVSTLRTDQKTVSAGTPAQRTPNAPTAATRTVLVPE